MSLSSSRQPLLSDDALSKHMPRISLLKKDGELPILNGITYNIGMFPDLVASRINGDMLDPNPVRRKALIEHLTASDYGIIALQEVWDKGTADTVIDALKDSHPYVVRGIPDSGCCPSKKNNGDNCFVLRGGLLLLSRYEIVDVASGIFPNGMLGEETIGDKGFIAIKIKLSDTEFATVYSTHLHAGGGITKSLSEWYGGTTSYRRGEQMGIISAHMESWATLPPEDAPRLKHTTTFFVGDTNVTLNADVLKDGKIDNRRMLSVSTGKSNNGMHADEIKYPGQYKLFKELEAVIPGNFASVMRPPLKQGGPRVIDDAKLKDAEKKGDFTGSINDGKPSPQATNKLIDVATFRKGGKNGEFKSKIVQLLDENKKPVSDHHAVTFEMNWARPPIKRQTIFDGSKPEEFKAVDPAAGGHHDQVVTRYRLFPQAEKKVEVSIKADADRKPSALSMSVFSN